MKFGVFDEDISCLSKSLKFIKLPLFYKKVLNH